MKRLFILASIAIAFAFLSCDSRPANFEGGVAENETLAVAELKEEQKVSDAKTTERKLIKNGTIEFSTKSVADVRKKIDQLANDYKAYIASDNQHNFDRRLQYEQVIRIPAERFDSFVKAIEGLGEEIEFRNLGTRDVTEEYIDVAARLKTKKELEVRYLELLKQAKNVEEMITVEKQIAGVRSEIEVMQGRINFLTDQVGYSTLTVKYYQVISTEPGFSSELFASFASGWDDLLAFIVGVTSIWPFILIMSGGVWLISRWSKRINLKIRKAAQP